MKLLSGLFLCLCLLSCTGNAYHTTDQPHQNQIDVEVSKNIVKWAKANLSQQGTLQQGRDGFIYLKVDQGYIDSLFPMIANTHYINPYLFRNPEGPGAHVSVFYESEGKKIGKIKELGKKFKFTLRKLRFVPAKTQKFMVMEIDAPQLEGLRVKYGFKPLLKKHKFHITIARKR